MIKKSFWIKPLPCLLVMLMACAPANNAVDTLPPDIQLAPPAQTASPEPVTSVDDEALEPIAYSPYSPIAVNGFLLGGVEGQDWIDEEAIFDKIEMHENYRIYVDGIFNGVEQGEKLPESEDEGYIGNRIQFAELSPGADDDACVLAVSNETNPFIRSLARMDASNAYYAMLARIAADNGYHDVHFTIYDAIELDIDGDSENELLISASNESAYTRDGVFASLLFMQKTVDGKLVEYFIDKTFFPNESDEENEGTNTLNRYKILDACDLNDDGALELIVKSTGIDLLEYGVFVFKDGVFGVVMSNGAGA